MEIPERLKRMREKGLPLVEKDGKMYVVIHDTNQRRIIVADENASVTSIERAGTVRVG